MCEVIGEGRGHANLVAFKVKVMLPNKVKSDRYQQPRPLLMSV